MTLFLVLGGLGLVVLLGSLVFGEFGGEVAADHDFLASGDYLSTTAIAGFASAFGLMGALVLSTSDSMPLSVISGLGAGIAVGTATGWFTRLLRRQQSELAPGQNAMLGLQGTVVSAIPSDGYGEVALVVAGLRAKVNARSLEPIAVGTAVTVVAVHSATAVQVDPVRGRPALP